MLDFAQLLEQGAGHAWLFIPSAIILGALHGLEPGHSKTMMAAFIVAIRGTVKQAILLGLCATLSHTLIVWIIALGGLYLWRGVAPEAIEPYLLLASGVIVILMGGWMIWRARRDETLAAAGHHHHHGDEGRDHHHHHHHHEHSHDHHGETRRIDTGHGLLRLDIHEDGTPPRFRLAAERGRAWPADQVALEIERPGGARQAFALIERDGFLESSETVPEPHDFTARLRLSHGDHAHAYDVIFREDGHHHAEDDALAFGGEFQDAHELAHANDIRRRFAGRDVTTAQIAIFGLTGGLIPCPGAITVLILCLQLREFALGAVLVLAFSVGLALTMVASGVLAAISVKHVSKRFRGFGELMRRAPYVSGVVILLIGLYMGVSGWRHLPVG